MTDDALPYAAKLDTGFFRDWIDLVAASVEAEKDRLTELDRVIGDGDHGTNLHRGFTAVRAALEAKQPETPGALAVLVGMTLISSVGGASGPLYGTVFRRMGKALGDSAPSVSVEALTAAFEAGVEGLRKLGGADEGDKTMVDAFVPALAALQAAVARDSSPTDALALAADAAEAGALATVPIRARKGRASYLAERSEGHQDPGAASTALIWRALADAAARGGSDDDGAES